MGTQHVFECLNCLGEGCPHCDGKGTMNRAQLDSWREFIVERVARVAELEAAGEWRPGSEEPPAPGWYLAWNRHHLALRHYIEYWNGEEWGLYPAGLQHCPEFWRPIPPPPSLATEAQP